MPMEVSQPIYDMTIIVVSPTLYSRLLDLPGEETNEALALEPLKEPDLSLQQKEAPAPNNANNPLAAPLKSAAIIMNQPDRDFLVDLPDLADITSYIAPNPLGTSFSPAYDLIEAIVNKGLKAEEYVANDHGVGVNNTDCVVCNYGPQGKSSNYIPSNLPGQCVGLDQCSSSLSETITKAGETLAAKGLEDANAFSTRLTERLTGSSFTGGNIENFDDALKGLEGLLQVAQPQVGDPPAIMIS